MATQDTVVQEKQPTETTPTETTPTETTMVATQETVAPAVTEPPGNRPAEKPAPQQAASEQVITSAAPLQAGPAVKADVKADYGWLMKVLLGRINELKNYPHLARINHWEGKVLLRAVIKDDGQVLMVDVQEGSGRSVLDNDAMETLRKASPLKLDHPLGKPQVTILMPISYSLR
jgi:protein TonB